MMLTKTETIIRVNLDAGNVIGLGGTFREPQPKQAYTCGTRRLRRSSWCAAGSDVQGKVESGACAVMAAFS